MSEEDKLKFRVKELKHFNDILEQQNLDKAKEIERLNNIINELDKLISVKIIRVANEEDYQIDVNDMVEIKTKLLELKGSDKE